MGRNNIAFIVLGVAALVLGISIKIFVGKRRFYRRNQAGLEGFKNYRNALLTPFVEGVLSFVGGMLVIAGSLCIGISFMLEK